MGKLDGKVAVITGAASGMGRATALRFAKEGAGVVLTDLNSNGGEEAVSECAAAGGKAVFQRTDVSSEADIKAASIARSGVWPSRHHVQQCRNRRRSAQSKKSQLKIGTGRWCVAAGGIPRDEVFDSRDAQIRRRIDYHYRFGCRPARGRLSGGLQCGQGRDRHLDPGSRDRGWTLDSGELHLPRRREHSTRSSRYAAALRGPRT